MVHNDICNHNNICFARVVYHRLSIYTTLSFGRKRQFSIELSGEYFLGFTPKYFSRVWDYFLDTEYEPITSTFIHLFKKKDEPKYISQHISVSSYKSSSDILF